MAYKEGGWSYFPCTQCHNLKKKSATYPPHFEMKQRGYKLFMCGVATRLLVLSESLSLKMCGGNCVLSDSCFSPVSPLL